MPSTVFALEIAARTYPNDPFRQSLHQLLRSAPPAQSPLQKQQLYYQLGQTVWANFGAIERGCWDYWPDHDRGIADFEMWTQGMLTEEGARLGPAYDAPPRYLTFTMAFLLVQGSATDQMLAQRCNVPEENLWRRDVFGYILQTVGYLDFTHIRSDVVYLIPGDDAFALTPQDLALPKFEYLRQLF